MSSKKRLGLLIGLVLFSLCLGINYYIMDVASPALAVAGLALLMAALWITEPIPIPVTSLLPIVLLPILGVMDIRAATAPYGHPLIFLFMGGFILALAMQKSQLHKRIALNLLLRFGTNPTALVGGFMVTCACLSMWVTNTATTMMMLPIGLSVIQLFREKNPNHERGVVNFSMALLLAIAYAATIGGLGTLIGTAPNAFMASFYEQRYGQEIDFLEWMKVGIPLMIIFLPITWFLLVKFLYPQTLSSSAEIKTYIITELHQLGAWSRHEKIVANIFLLTIALWVFKGFILSILPFIQGLNDTSIALFAAIILFLIPVNAKQGKFAMDWESCKQLPWGLFLLFGGGLSLAGAITKSGLSEQIGSLLGAFIDVLGGVELGALLVVAMIVALIIFLTEITSNTATTAAFLPVMVALAEQVAMEPPLLLLVPTTLAASCAFMLPVATPPNAVIYGSGLLRVEDMVRAGVWVNLTAFVLILVYSHWILPLTFF